MKIGITCYPTYGGSGAVATELGIALAGRGHEVHFITWALPFRLATFVPNVFFHEVEVSRYPLFEYPPYDLALASQLHDCAVSEGLDLLHVHYAIPHATAAWLATQMMEKPIPFITTLHGTDITLVGAERSFRRITQFSIDESDAITAVSDYLADETTRAFGIERSRIEVIPNFVNPERYDPAKAICRKSMLAPGGEKIILHISNFRPVKRIPDVVRIFAGIRAAMPARLVLVGDGPERTVAQELAQELGVAQDILFLGKVESVSEILACGDLFLLPSESESFGLAALEAMASGVPVVASAVGGLPEVIDDGKTGILANVGDVATMTREAVALLQNPERRKAMGVAARASVGERFSEERVVTQYEQLYHTVIERFNS